MGGKLCLDFVNTVGGRDEDSILRDKFTSSADLAEWAQGAGVLSAAEAAACRRLGAAGTLMKRALGLREAIYGIARSLIEGHAPAGRDLDVFNREIAAAATHRRLAFAHGRLAHTWDGANPLVRVLWTVGDSASALFTSAEAAAIRQCPGDECGWLFLDTSRNHSRRWCEMRICGNRAKVRRFRENM